MKFVVPRFFPFRYGCLDHGARARLVPFLRDHFSTVPGTGESLVGVLESRLVNRFELIQRCVL